MQVKIVNKKDNPLLKRREVQFTIEHNQGKTPTRLDIKRSVASELGISDKFVFVKNMKTLTGSNITVGAANAYESEAQAKLIEPDYIVKRNVPAEKKEEAKE
jgi:small subunit ribosomal protein S24e